MILSAKGTGGTTAFLKKLGFDSADASIPPNEANGEEPDVTI